MCIRDRGNGSSITAVKNGKVLDTSMGLTPLDGFMMGTRSGALDPSVVTFIAEKENMTPYEMSELLNKKSGLLGISGISSDDRDVSKAEAEGDERAILAHKMLVYEKMCIRDSCYTMMNEWWKQLYGESEGKDHKGLFPASVVFSTDLHSMGQFIQDGSRTMFETVVLFDKAKKEIVMGNDPENVDGQMCIRDSPCSTKPSSVWWKQGRRLPPFCSAVCVLVMPVQAV